MYPEVGEAVTQARHAQRTVITQAPTGSTGTMVGTSTGIEPYFAFEYYRQSRLGFDKQYVPIAQQWKDAHPGEELPDYFVTSMGLSAEDHIRVQAAIQRWVDSSISKTANCPHDFTVEETKKLYELAFELGCKGVTIYRDGSRDVQVLSTKKEETRRKRSRAAEDRLTRGRRVSRKRRRLRCDRTQTTALCQCDAASSNGNCKLEPADSTSNINVAAGAARRDL